MMDKLSSTTNDVTIDCSLLMMGKRQNNLQNDCIRCVSLGVGNFPENAPVMFLPSPAATECSSGVYSSENSSLVEHEDEASHPVESFEKCPSPLALAVEQLIQVERGLESMVERSLDFFVEKASNIRQTKKKISITVDGHVQVDSGPFAYMKVSDLSLAMELCSTAPTVAVKETDAARWVRLGVGSNVVQPTVKALAEVGLIAISNEKLWRADKKTERVIQGRDFTSCSTHAIVLEYMGTPKDTHVLTWSGKFSYCGHDIPVYRSSGIIAMAPDELIYLLLDSSRIHEYNKVSEGRTDEIIYTNNLCAEGVTKVVRSKSKPPIVSKSLEFTSLMHARKLKEADGHGEGYILVTRGVTLGNEKTDIYAPEILLNVSLIKKIDGLSKKCEMINMNYVSMPIIPSFLVKKLGYNGAVSFINDLRSLCARDIE
jgi:hypothetical protein